MNRGHVLVTVLIPFGLVMFGCSDQGEPVSVVLKGTYRGSFRIQLNSNVQQGTVTLTFVDTQYDQQGRIASPPGGTIPDFQSSGTLTVNGNTITFNPTCDQWAKLTASWFLCGEFAYKYESGSVIIEQSRNPSSVYTMVLQKAM